MRRNSFSAECGVLALFCIKFCNNIKTEEAIEIVNYYWIIPIWWFDKHLEGGHFEVQWPDCEMQELIHAMTLGAGAADSGNGNLWVMQSDNSC